MMTESGKISIAYFSDSPYTGGAEKYIYHLASNIDRDRFERYVIINNRVGLKRLESWLAGSGIKVYSLDYEPPFSISNSWSLFRLLRKNPVDIFHINLPGSYDAGYGLAAPVARLAGIKRVVSTEHLPMYPSFPKGRLLKGITTRSIERVIAVSKDNQRHLIDNHHISPEKIEVIYNGIPRVEIERNSNERESRSRFVVAVIGALHRRKGHFTVFDAMKKLPENIRLIIAGEGEMEKEYRAYVKENGLDDRTEFLGHRDDIGELLSKVDLLALPSTLEATPYVILEAMSAGIPVVASAVFGIPELVTDGETGFLVEAGDSGGFARSISRLFSDTELFRRVSREAKRDFEKRFTIERSVGQTESLYEKVMGIEDKKGRER